MAGRPTTRQIRAPADNKGTDRLFRSCHYCAMSETEIQRVLDFWFSGGELDSPGVDSRMDRWFGNSEVLDREIREGFGGLVEQATNGELDHWAGSPEGRLALIILLDQFRRNIYRGDKEAFLKDEVALALCNDGIKANMHEQLTPEQRLFFFMPMQHCESLDVQKKAVDIFHELAESVTETMRESFVTSAQFAELHHDIVEQFGRFPHRNRILGRENTVEEESYLTGDASSFGQ
jgi:uncharacterized protein (DUF924 family)